MNNIVLTLHNIRSVYNVGSLFRTADAAGVRKIFLTGITPAPIDALGKIRKDFVKVSLGAEKTVPYEKIKNISSVLAKLKKEGYKIFAVEQSRASISYSKIPQSYFLYPKFCLVLGNEVRGLSSSLLRQADKVLEIPMRGKKESLNVGVAGAIVLFHCVYGYNEKGKTK